MKRKNLQDIAVRDIREMVNHSARNIGNRIWGNLGDRITFPLGIKYLGSGGEVEYYTNKEKGEKITPEDLTFEEKEDTRRKLIFKGVLGLCQDGDIYLRGVKDFFQRREGRYEHYLRSVSNYRMGLNKNVDYTK